ncbi:3'-5' exonuclease [Pseudomonas sp. NFACC05-1]|uniref:3'-5' exonuclease n=1 Tax=Pseudomonas sp. NFACC05-1 TaxID=1566241 RepID=UPI000871A320|nr:3'-5' exonuclease [Pseudomonas sp. NFACC05-1]SCW91943.1 DNA polymerase-3 subunit epsilon [Pseudomonas sp. NFACC05-1]
MSDLICVFDTETTGFPNWKIPSDDPSQPHIVDICALLFTPQGELVDSFEAMVRPDGWEIPNEVAVIHGITTEIAMAQGIPEIEALDHFLRLYKRAGLRVAHNVSFDDRILRIAIKRFVSEQAADEFKAVPSYCTAINSKPILCLPPTEKMKATNFKNSFKTPTVAEALLHFTGEELVGGHRARPDTEACARVYWAMNPPAQVA